jgi:hypothetical protein
MRPKKNKQFKEIQKRTIRLISSQAKAIGKKKRKNIKTGPSDKRKKMYSIDKMYFTSDTENRIVQYNKEADSTERDKIYNLYIKYPFEKLVENIINRFKFSYFEVSSLDIQKETVSHLVLNMHKFDPTLGFKAYSYFSIIAKNYLIFLNNTNYKRFNQHVDISEEKDDHTVQLQSEDSYYKDKESSEYMNLIVNFWEINAPKIFTKNKDLTIANAVIELFRNYQRIDAVNKKALYLYIREICGCRTQSITKILNKMRGYQDVICRAYKDTGTVPTNIKL